MPTQALQLEVGDLLFVTANLARHLQVDPEMALRDANSKFRSRFSAMETAEREEDGPPLEERSLEALEGLWQAAKRLEKVSARDQDVRREDARGPESVASIEAGTGRGVGAGQP